MKKYLDIIVENGKKEDMDKLGDILIELINDLKINNNDMYKKYKTMLMGMAYNYKFNEEMAKEIVENMKPLGEYWNLETINEVKNTKELKEDLYELYVVMNSMANDYGEVINLEDVDTYVKLSEAFINDEDASKDKVWKYFTKIAK